MIHFVALLALLPISFALLFAIIMFCLATITTFGFGFSRLATSIGMVCCPALPLVNLVFLVARIWGLSCFGSGLEILVDIVGPLPIAIWRRPSKVGSFCLRNSCLNFWESIPLMSSSMAISSGVISLSLALSSFLAHHSSTVLDLTWVHWKYMCLLSHSGFFSRNISSNFARHPVLVVSIPVVGVTSLWVLRAEISFVSRHLSTKLSWQRCPSWSCFACYS